MSDHPGQFICFMLQLVSCWDLHAAPEEVSERYALFYVRKTGHFIDPKLALIDELRCHAKL